MRNVVFATSILDMFSVMRKHKSSGDRAPTWRVKILLRGPQTGEEV